MTMSIRLFLSLEPCCWDGCTWVSRKACLYTNNVLKVEYAYIVVRNLNRELHGRIIPIN